MCRNKWPLGTAAVEGFEETWGTSGLLGEGQAIMCTHSTQLLDPLLGLCPCCSARSVVGMTAGELAAAQAGWVGTDI